MNLQKDSYAFTQFIFTRLLGVIYLIAFISLWVQIQGLVGSHGILPVAEFLTAIKQNYGIERLWILPTVFWFNASDISLHVVCALGVIFSLFVMAGILPAWSLFILWALYLSILTIGRDFLSFQWDILLLEVGLLAVFFAPWKIFSFRPTDEKPSWLALWLLRIVLFKLMFQSGLVKLLSHDLAWINLTALTYHYFTQPIPNPLSWSVHHWPLWAHKVSCGIMFFVELFVPFLIFCGRWGRLTAAVCISSLMVVVIFTGNYCFFNLLTILLCLLLLDDNIVSRFIPVKFKEIDVGATGRSPLPEIKTWCHRLFLGMLSCAIIFVTFIHWGRLIFRIHNLPQPVLQAARTIGSFASINSYGLFAVMTKTRPEIIIEGSNDGWNWQEYEFKYKVGDLKRRPPQVAPHQPRLDWQMWFAALTPNCQYDRWFVMFEQKLLEGSGPVLKLLEKNPFPDQPPRYIRATKYLYEFTDVKTKNETGAWWQRQYDSPYCPPISLGSR